MTTPLVETDGDGQQRSWWRQIKEELIHPFVELEAEYYDLGREKRRATGDRIVSEAAEAEQYYGVAVKCEAATAEGLILAWADALGKRARLDGQRELETFAGGLSEACRRAMEEGFVHGSELIGKVQENLKKTQG